MKEEQNQRFTAFNQLNKKVYFHGVDGGWIFTFLGIIVCLSFAVSIIFFKQPLPALPIACLLISGLFKFLQRYRTRLKHTGLDDPLERDMEIGKQRLLYRDDQGFLS